MDAAQKGQKDVVRALLKKGAEVEAKDRNGWTPLAFAVNSGNTDISHILFDKGADVNAKDEHGTTALMLATSKEDASIVVVKALIAKGADVNAKETIIGLTVLMNAAQNGNADIVRILLANGADVNAKTEYGKTALMFAARNDDLSRILGQGSNAKGHADSAQLLKDAGAK